MRHLIPALILIVLGTLFLLDNLGFPGLDVRELIATWWPLLLILGGVVGAQIGTVLGARLRAEQLRVLLALLVLVVCGRLAFDLVLPPAELFSIAPVRP